MIAVPARADGAPPYISPLETDVAFTVDLSAALAGQALLGASVVDATWRYPEQPDSAATAYPGFVQNVVAGSPTAASITLVCGDGAQRLGTDVEVTISLLVDSTPQSTQTLYVSLPVRKGPGATDDRGRALALLGAQAAAATYPTLDSAALDALLDATTRYTVWTPATRYVHGQVVIPTVRNGHLYRAIVNQQYSASPAGVSAGSEPIWPLFSSPDSKVGTSRPYWSGYDQQSGNYALSMVADGTVVWQDAGPDGAIPWDVRLATYNAWHQKAALATADYDATVGGDRFRRSEVVQHCLAMALRYVPTGIA